jgi:hypothetical protein
MKSATLKRNTELNPVYKPPNSPTKLPISSSVGIANLPNQRHKIVTKKGISFTIAVVGTFLRF